MAESMKPRTRRSASIDLVEFVRPEPAWPWPYSIEMAFGVLQCLIASASDQEFVEQHQWHASCAVGLMGGEGAKNGACRVITSINDLRSRFAKALLASDRCRPEVARWREKRSISPVATLDLKFRHYKPMAPPAHLPWESEVEIQKALTLLLEGSIGQRLTTQLNSVHDGARTVHGVGVVVGPKKFRFMLEFGFLDPRVERFDSAWFKELAVTKGDEPFLDTLSRAIDQYRQWTPALAVNEAACDLPAAWDLGGDLSTPGR